MITLYKMVSLLLLLCMSTASFADKPITKKKPCHDIVRIVPPRKMTESWKKQLKNLTKTIADTFYDSRAGENKIGNVRLLAWCTKTYDGSIPQSVGEEMIVLITWTPSNTYSLVYFVRNISDGRVGVRPWHVSRARDGLTKYAYYETKPTEKQIVEFVHNTNFGKNSYGMIDKEYPTIVLAIFCYANEMKDFIRELERGIPDEEKKRRNPTVIE